MYIYNPRVIPHTLKYNCPASPSREKPMSTAEIQARKEHNNPELMLMMCVTLSKLGPADAHDAGGLGSHRPNSAHLMLMMLAAGGHIVQTGPSWCLWAALENTPWWWAWRLAARTQAAPDAAVNPVASSWCSGLRL